MSTIMEKINCSICNQEFQRSVVGQKYCSSICSKEGARLSNHKSYLKNKENYINNNKSYKEANRERVNQLALASYYRKKEEKKLMQKNIFDLMDLADIPEELRNEILPAVETIITAEIKILKLFDMTAEPLAIAHIRIAYYRKYQEILSASSAKYQLARLVKLGKIQRLQKGFYQKINAEMAK